jgi:hypothetical protein
MKIIECYGNESNMISQELHPSRCETCTKIRCLLNPEYPGASKKYDSATLVTIREWISTHGCSTHSDSIKRTEFSQDYLNLPHDIKNKKLLEYIDLKIEALKQSKYKSHLIKLKPERREMVRRQIRGRLLELVALKTVIHRGDYEKESVLEPLRRNNLNNKEKLVCNRH